MLIQCHKGDFDVILMRLPLQNHKREKIAKIIKRKKISMGFCPFFHLLFTFHTNINFTTHFGNVEHKKNAFYSYLSTFHDDDGHHCASVCRAQAHIINLILVFILSDYSFDDVVVVIICKRKI